MIKKLFISLLFIFGFSCSLVGASLSADEEKSHAHIFLEAATKINAGDLTSAISDLQMLVKGGFINNQVHYNLGICYFRLNQLGQAIYHFNKAKTLSPRDADINYNLNYAKSKTIDKIEDKRSVVVTFLPQFSFYYKRALLYLGHYYLFTFSFQCALYFFQKRVAIMAAKKSDHSFCHHSHNPGHKIGYRSTLRGRHPTVDRKYLFRYWSKHNVLLFSLHEGTRFDVEDAADSEWLRISLADGKKGWIKKSHAIF